MKIRNIRYWILAADLLCIFGALIIAIELRYRTVLESTGLTRDIQSYALMVLVASLTWLLLYFEMGLDGFKGGWQFASVFSKLIVAVSVLMLIVLAVAFLARCDYSRLVLLCFVLFFVLGLIGVRCLARSVLTSRLRSIGDHRCVILGNGRVARELAGKIAAHPELHFDVVGFLYPGESEAPTGFAGSLRAPVASMKTLQVLDLLAREGVQKLIVVMSPLNGTEVRKLISECRKSSIQVYVVPEWYDLYVSEAKLVDIDGLPLLSLAERRPSNAMLALKRGIDVVLSAGILLIVSPLLLLAAFFVYRDKGKAFRSEIRCGKNGTPFRMYRLNVERHGTHPKRFERLFIRWSLTELPQLWNVLRGEMSLVGPRPESIERTKNYSDWQRQRLKVCGGVTGLAQVHGLREQHSSEDKARFDLQYILNWSPLLDLSLILQTVWTLLFRGLSREPQATQDAVLRNDASGYVSQGAIDVNRP